MFVRNIFIYALFSSFFLEPSRVFHSPLPPPSHVLRWRYQYPCHRSDTAHAVSINILQSLILLHLNYLSRVIRVYILSKPNPKWGIWLLVCLSWIFKSSIKHGVEIDQFGQLWCSRKGRGSAEMMAEGLSDPATPPNWQWRSGFVSNSKACRPIGGVRLQFHAACRCTEECAICNDWSCQPIRNPFVRPCRSLTNTEVTADKQILNF